MLQRTLALWCCLGCFSHFKFWFTLHKNGSHQQGPPSTLSEKVFIWISCMGRFICVWAPGSVSQRLINSDTGWQFSRNSDISYHTCAGDWRAFTLVTFPLWNYPLSLIAVKQVSPNMSGREWKSLCNFNSLVRIWNNNKLNRGPIKVMFL